ncbi:chemotaxis protein CheW [Argonema antarcticum]|uniref:chemotaxis protein CheW n=1 Tax=Argonema antarcticum TaxID=2942763 RepID=UPI0023DFA2B4|nr:chemotaxis protein CheW [Argonema antarcticum]
MLTIAHKAYLIFSVNGSLYGVEAESVVEIFSFPELTFLPEAPPEIIGVVNLRGDILPVMDLNLRFGYNQLEYCLTDSVIVVEWQKLRVGMIVNQVNEVYNLSPEDMTKELFYDREVPDRSRSFVCDMAKVAADIVMLLNIENLLSYSKSVEPLDGDKNKYNLALETVKYTKERIFCPQATPEERAIFRERSQNLMRSSEKEDLTGLIPLAVIGLSGEYFGLDLKLIREFTDIRKVTPVPCCPPHIIGNMNLRGEIVTLVDVRRLLNMPILGAETTAKVMVVCVDDLVAGIKVDEVFDVMYLHPAQISPVPAAVHSINDEYLQGTAPYGGKMMSLLDLQKMFNKGDMIVNEEI